MKTDFHLHSPASILNGDSINWSNTPDIIRKLWNNKVGAFAFTDHNVFDSKLFLDAKSMCKNNIFVFPGVEINIVKADGVIAHLILLFDRELDESKVIKLEKLCKDNLRKRGIKIDAVNEIFKDYEYIAIPHVGKGDFFKVDELDFDHVAIETTSEKNANYKRWIKHLNNKSIVAFSDTHIWKDYPQNEELTTDIDFDGSFKDLKEKLTLNKSYIN